MSAQLINRSPDLRRLREEGHDIAIVADHLVVRSIPYVDAGRNIRLGSLVSELTLADDRATKPGTHVMHFIGEYPCDADGQRIEKIFNQTSSRDLGAGLVIEHSFSSKPPEGYPDYYEKVSAYIAMLANPAQAIDPSVTALCYRVIDSVDTESPFVYVDTATSRAQIGVVNQKLRKLKIAIIGVGGTGAYVLDQIAKTPVDTIDVFDPKVFLQHNAFRAPGAACREDLAKKPFKTDYFCELYSKMHRGIQSHPIALTEENLNLLDGIDFVFLCLDAGNAKAAIINKLEQDGVSFVDVGMGIELVNDELIGIVRLTTSTPKMRQHVHEKKRIPLQGDGQNNLYDTNIQTADLNMLNAAMAVMKWKKIYHVYMDMEEEHFTALTIDGNHLLNEDNQADKSGDVA